MAAVVGVTMLDIACAQGLTLRHSRGRGPARAFSDRSGWPKGLEHARGAARDFETPRDMRANLQPDPASPMTGEATGAV